MSAIIKSILDSDLYKFSMQNWVIEHYSEIDVEYTFNNRDKSMKFNQKAVDEIKHQIKLMSKLRLTDCEYDWMKNTLYFLPIAYRQYLAAYRFNPNQVNVNLNPLGELEISIKGKWRDTILWEVPLMAIISEVYFTYMDKDWSMKDQVKLANDKAKKLSDAGCLFTDFGSRRRRNFETQDIVVREMKKYKGFAGTSNPYLAMIHNVKALGTCAHEAVGAVAAIESLNHPNKIFMERWTETYHGSLGTMLPDTYGLDSFLKDFTSEKAKLWDGVRWDSGSWKKFTDCVIEHYQKLNIDANSKTIIFSDGLNTDTAIEIKKYCEGKIRCSFGIGTFFTSDFIKKSNSNEKSKPMNMVIKLTMANGIPVVKLSDSPGKAIGDPKMIEIMIYIHIKNYSIKN
jgi:nicotinate phosphoribosyltransferase